MLSDGEIRLALKHGGIKLSPEPADHDIQPASIDVHLGGVFGRLIKPDVKEAQHTRLSQPVEIELLSQDEYVLHPGQFVLAHLLERLSLSGWFGARIEGKSSVGRKGILVHVTAGFVDPGWDGNLTLELYNASPIAYLLCKGDAIAQLSFEQLKMPAERPYGHPALGSHYQHSNEVRGSLAE